MKILEQELIKEHQHAILSHPQFDRFINDERIEDLRRSYELLKRVDGLHELKN